VQLDWTTFLLEIGNFLILVWILQRFLYRPVLDVIRRRREGIEKALAEAKSKEEEAREIDAKARARLDDWERERGEARARLGEEMAAERSRRLQQIEEALKGERDKAQALAARKAEEDRRSLERRSIEQGALFASRLLERLACPALDAQIVHALVEDIASLPDDQRRAIAEAASRPGVQVRIETARPLEADDRQRLSGALQALCARSLEESVHDAPELIAGLRVAVGPWVLAANLRDELAFFREGAQRAD
jgi:F-type H+-transporting ATPase subunit b